MPGGVSCVLHTVWATSCLQEQQWYVSSRWRKQTRSGASMQTYLSQSGQCQPNQPPSWALNLSNYGHAVVQKI